MDRNKDFLHSDWIGVPQALYQGQSWSGRLETQTAYFRREFDLPKAGKLTIHISATSRYRLYINGASILSGPCKGDRWRHFYESLDVSEYLVCGRNLIAVKVVAYPPIEAQHENGDGQGPLFSVNSAAGPCLAVSGNVIGADGRKLASVNTGTDEWKVCLDSAIEWKTPHLSFWMGGMEIVHGDRLPTGWESSFAPKGLWNRAERRWPTQPDKYGQIFPFPLTRRPIPLLYERAVSFAREMPLKESEFTPFTFDNGPAVIPPGTKAAIELDAGALTTAYVAVRMKGGKGAGVAVMYAESYANAHNSQLDMPEEVRNPADAVIFLEKGDRNDSLRYSFIGHQDVYYPTGDEEVYRPFWFRTFRFLRMEICTGGEAITLEKPSMVETGYPLEFVSEFHSSDKTYEKIWEISKNTLQRCMHETHEDCPYYEQLQYTMDTRMQILFTYALCGDTRMAKRTIEDYHASLLPDGMLQSRYPTQSPQVIPVFALHWIFMLEDYFEQTGDQSVPRRYRPTVDAVLDWYERHTGNLDLVEHMPYWQFVDWVEEWEENAGMPNAGVTGPSSIQNLEYAYALQAAARLNRLTGRGECAVQYEAKANHILRIVEKLCWDEEAGLYREGPDLAEYSQHAQAFAVLTGLAAGEKAKSILSKALNQKGLSQCSFPLMFYFIRALEQAGIYGRSTVFFDILKELIALNVTTIPETHFKPRSECHAWGAFALYEFPRAFLGVKPGGPGWETIVIQPQITGVSDCGGVVYTPKGNVEIAWEKSGESAKIYGYAPEGVRCTVILPDGRREVLEQGGRFAVTGRVPVYGDFNIK